MLNGKEPLRPQGINGSMIVGEIGEKPTNGYSLKAHATSTEAHPTFMGGKFAPHGRL